MNKLPIHSISAYDPYDLKNAFYANVFSVHLRKNPFISIPHKHDFYMMVLFTKGSGSHEIDFNQYTIEKGSLFFLSPGQTHNWRLSEDIEGYILFHTRSFYQDHFPQHAPEEYPFYESEQRNTHYVLNAEDLKGVERDFIRIYKEYRRKNVVLKSRKLAGLISALYVDLSRLQLGTQKEVSKTMSYHTKLIQFENLLEEYYMEEHSASFYADQVFVSQRHLNRICQETIGKSTSDVISDRVVLEAKRMLIHTDMRVSEIAISLGFEDKAYFSRFFKKHEKTSPLSFRNIYRE